MFLKTHLIILLILTIVISHQLHSQTAVPWLLVQPSPELNGMAGAYTALPTDDPYGSYYNPAQIGNFGRHENFAVHFYLNDVTWLPQFGQLNFSDMSYTNLAFGLGFNLQKIYPKVPLSIGLGYIRTRFEIQDNVVTDQNGVRIGTFSSIESVNAFSIGLTVDYVLLFSIGYTFKHINSQLFDEELQVGAERGDGESSANAGDFGLQLVLPILKSYEYFSEKKTAINNKFQPFLDLALGYTLANIGDGMTYINEAEANPFPHQARMGYSISTGLKQITPDINIGLFSFDWSSEARDLLVQWDAAGFEYQSSPGDIKFWDHVILAKSDENVQIHQGWRISALETIRYSRGRFQFQYSTEFQKTWGLVISTIGLLKYLNTLTNDDTIDYISKHFELRYSQSSLLTDDDPDNDNNGTFRGLALYLFGF